MTAVAAPPAFSQLDKQRWGTPSSGVGSTNPSMSPPNPDSLHIIPRKTPQRTNSSSSLASTASSSSTSTVATSGSSIGTSPSSTGEPAPLSLYLTSAAISKKRPQDAQAKQPRAPYAGTRTSPPNSSLTNNSSINGPKQAARALSQAAGIGPQQMSLSAEGQLAQTNGRDNSSPNTTNGSGMAANGEQNNNAPVLLYLSSLNGTFERKSIPVPTVPDVLRIGRQTNQKTAPTHLNGYFDSKVLSRQHAEIWADRNGRVWIRDVKSSNGTFVNGTRLSPENRESGPHELQTGDHLELGIDIIGEDGKTVIHHKVSAKVEHAGIASASNGVLDFGLNELDPTNNGMLGGSPGVQGRARAGSNPGVLQNGRMAGGIMAAPAVSSDYRRPFMITPVTTENIIKKLQGEIRGARLQEKSITRSHDFVNVLMSKEALAAPVAPSPKAAVNGYHSYRADPMSRFLDPPAPPPQQPLPEKPTDVPSLRKSMSGPVKSHSSLPPREPSGQVLQLQSELETYKQMVDKQGIQLRALEENLASEYEARLASDELNEHLQQIVSASHNTSGSPTPESPTSVPQAEVQSMIEAATGELQSKLDTMQEEMLNMQREMLSMQQQVEVWKQKYEKADVARSIASKHLAEMVLRIREESESRSRGKPRSRVRGARKHSTSSSESSSDSEASKKDVRSQNHGHSGTQESDKSTSPSEDDSSFDEKLEIKKLTAGSTEVDADIKPDIKGVPSTSRSGVAVTKANGSQQLIKSDMLTQSLPYASIVGVVIIGMGMMAFINGWQPQPRVEQ